MSMFSFLFFLNTGLLFQFVKPLFGEKSIQFANGEEGRRRNKTYQTVFSHGMCVQALPELNKVSQANQLCINGSLYFSKNRSVIVQYRKISI